KTPRSRGLGPWRSGSAEREVSALACDRHDVGRLGALLPLAGLELDPGALVQRLVALARDLREMDEQVLAALVGGDEPIALRSVEPLHGTGSHVHTSLTTHERVEKALDRVVGTRSWSRPEPSRLYNRDRGRRAAGSG